MEVCEDDPGAGRAADGDRLGGGWMLTSRCWRLTALPFVLLLCRFSLVPGLHPDWMLMLFFAHTHLTVTVTLCLLLVPKVTSSGV